MAFTARVRMDHPHGLFESKALVVESADYGLVAVNVGAPNEVSVMAGASQMQFLSMLYAIVGWGANVAGVTREEILDVIDAALEAG